jgi:hypothetical protein
MFRLGADLKVYLHREPIDFRAGINSLAVLVQETMALDPFAPAVFEQLSAMVTLLIQVQASARAIPIRPGHKAHVLRLRSRELTDGLTPKIERYRAEIARRQSPPAPRASHLRLVVNNVRQVRP